MKQKPLKITVLRVKVMMNQWMSVDINRRVGCALFSNKPMGCFFLTRPEKRPSWLILTHIPTAR
jgi:hypothetical protein